MRTLTAILPTLLFLLHPSIGEGKSEGPFNPWDLKELRKPPKVFPSDIPGTNQIKSLFYEGVPWKGKPTRIFAFYGIPPGKRNVPAMILVHGGGGTAFKEWVQLWNDRGYAALAMDTCGSVPIGRYGNWEGHPHGGPRGWGGFEQIDEPLSDQWTYHAVAAVIRGHSLLRSMPEVNANKIGITGISWGGYLTCIAAGVDDRFKFAAPVYGCGFLGENSAWLDTFSAMGPEKSKKWLGWWDPSVYLPRAKMPFLWVTGTTDFAYPMDSLRKSYQLPNTKQTLAIRVNMPHGHMGPGEKPEEIHAFANYLFMQGIPLPEFKEQGQRDNLVWAEFKARRTIKKAELNFTKDTHSWMKRTWQSVPAAWDGVRAKTELPADTSVYFFNIFDEKGHVTSSPHVELRK